VNPLEDVEAEIGPLLVRAGHTPCLEPDTCTCEGIVWLVASVHEWELDRWALVGIQPPPMDLDRLEEAYSDPDDQELGSRFVAAFGVPWAALDDRLLKGHQRLWQVPEVQDWLLLEQTTCEQLLTLRTYTGDRPSQASRAIVLLADYRRVVQ
jgi:hypothetical protein